jgi:hypothetical protein
MTLNASGPISLGGATVGQSINLELGQAATANTSLNATNVRTLLQVPSGQISLSNAYGKSNVTAWMLYMGLPAGDGNQGKIIPRSYFVAPNGVSAINVVTSGTSATPAGGSFMYVNPDGTQVNASASKAYGGASYSNSGNWGSSAGNSNSSSFRVPIYWDSRHNSVTQTSTSALAWASGTAMLIPVNQPGNSQWAATDSTGGVLFGRYGNYGKGGYRPTLIKYDSSGVNTATTVIQRSQQPDGTTMLSVLVRSDNQFLVSTGIGGNTRFYVVPNANTTGFTPREITGYQAAAAAINLSDNSMLFLVGDGWLITNSGYTTYTRNTLSNYGFPRSNVRNIWGCTYYNGYYYAATRFNNLGTDLDAVVVIAINASTGAVYWSTKFQFITSGSVCPVTQFSRNESANSIYANASGVFVACYLNSSITASRGAFIINIPLTGGLSSTTYSNVNGSTMTMTVSAANATINSTSSGSVVTPGSSTSISSIGTNNSSTTTDPNTGDAITMTPKTTIT